MNEASKFRARATREGWFEKVIHGEVLDVGCGEDPIVPHARKWDLIYGDGDAQHLAGVPDSSFDTVFSSHCLEHMYDPFEAIANWWRVVRPGGHLVVLCPDEDLYEQGVWPSVWNNDHKRTFSTSKHTSWSPDHVNMVDLVRSLPSHRLRLLRYQDEGYDYSKQQLLSAFDDQTQHDVDVSIEMVLEKITAPLRWVSSHETAPSCSRCNHGPLWLEGTNDQKQFVVKCPKCYYRMVVDIP